MVLILALLAVATRGVLPAYTCNHCLCVNFICKHFLLVFVEPIDAFSPCSLCVPVSNSALPLSTVHTLLHFLDKVCSLAEPGHEVHRSTLMHHVVTCPQLVGCVSTDLVCRSSPSCLIDLSQLWSPGIRRSMGWRPSASQPAFHSSGSQPVRTANVSQPQAQEAPVSQYCL